MPITDSRRSASAAATRSLSAFLESEPDLMTTLARSLDRSRLITVVGIVGFAAALAAGSQVAIPIPGTPVPITLQPFLVVLAGMMLGPVAGAASMLLYIAAGMSGLPVWAPIG